jgi:hypothetical protein
VASELLIAVRVARTQFRGSRRQCTVEIRKSGPGTMKITHRQRLGCHIGDVDTRLLLSNSCLVSGDNASCSRSRIKGFCIVPRVDQESSAPATDIRDRTQVIVH